MHVADGHEELCIYTYVLTQNKYNFYLYTMQELLDQFTSV